MRTVTERYYVLTAEWADDRRPVSMRVEPPNSVDDADRLAEEYLARGAIRVCVEPFSRPKS